MARQIFTSRLSSILALMGVSIGLGNVWRFPYMMGKFGGSAFLFVYVLFTVLFAVPALEAELALGRESRKGPLGAFALAFGPAAGTVIGYLLLFTVLIADSYYIVVVGNVFFTTWFSITNGFTQENNSQFIGELNNGWIQFFFSAVILLASLMVIKRGLIKGIEAVSKWMVPFFFIIVLVLIVEALVLKGGVDKMLVFLKPDIAAINSAVLFAALGQAFFSLGLGGTFLLMYGSYMDEKQSISKSAIATAAGDVGSSLMAALFIVPVILVFNLDMNSGPNLIFITLPRMFSQIPAGRLMGTLLLLSLTMVGFLSDIAALEVLVGGIKDDARIRWTKNRTIIFVGLLELVLIAPSAFYPKLVGYLDLIFGSGMQILGSVFAVIGLTWGLSKMTAEKQITGGKTSTAFNLYFAWLKWVVPGALLAILISYIYSIAD
jgi:NSS family neurotransmitter:Na+ symporter